MKIRKRPEHLIQKKLNRNIFNALQTFSMFRTFSKNVLASNMLGKFLNALKIVMAILAHAGGAFFLGYPAAFCIKIKKRGPY
jgi:hypothetical protein